MNRRIALAALMGIASSAAQAQEATIEKTFRMRHRKPTALAASLVPRDAYRPMPDGLQRLRVDDAARTITATGDRAAVDTLKRLVTLYDQPDRLLRCRVRLIRATKPSQRTTLTNGSLETLPGQTGTMTLAADGNAYHLDLHPGLFGENAVSIALTLARTEVAAGRTHTERLTALRAPIPLGKRRPLLVLSSAGADEAAFAEWLAGRTDWPGEATQLEYLEIEVAPTR